MCRTDFHKIEKRPWLYTEYGKTDAEMQKNIAMQHGFGLLVGRQADADACTRCGACEEACTQHLNIIDRLDEIAKWESVQKAGLKGWLRRVKRALLRDG